MAAIKAFPVLSSVRSVLFFIGLPAVLGLPAGGKYQMVIHANGRAPTTPFDPIEFQAGPQPGNPTVHLRCAAHLDRGYRDDVIRELIENQHRVPAPAPGTDSALVLGECLRARRQDVLSGSAVLLVLLVGLAVSRQSAGIALGAAVTMRILGALAGLAARIWARRFDADPKGRGATRVRRAVLYVFSSLWGSIILLSGLLLNNATQSGTGAYGTPQPATQTGGGGGSPGVVVILLCWVLIGAVNRYCRQDRVARIVASPEPLPVRTPARLDHVFDRLRRRQADAETVYGNFTSFVGSGIPYPLSFLCVELRPATPGREAAPLSSADLHARIAAAVAHLASGFLHPGDSLHRITVRDRLFRSGLRSDDWRGWNGQLSELDPRTGVAQLNGQWAEEFDRVSHERIRHYLEISAKLWQSQVVPTVFVRVLLQGNQLYLECVPFVLPPVADRFQAVDETAPPDPVVDGLLVLYQSVVHLGRDVVGSVAEIGSALCSWARDRYRRRWYARMVASHHLVDHAPRLSLREVGSEREYQQQFQRLDVERFLEAVLKRTTGTVLGTLKLAGYDTSEFERMAQNITINNGIQVSGQATVNGAMAAGQGASAQQINIPAPRLASAS